MDYFSAGSEKGKIIPYYAGNTAMQYIRNYAHAKVRTHELLGKLRDEFTDEKQRQSVDALINQIITKVVAPDSSIIGRRNNRGIRLVESVNLDINPSKDVTIFSMEEQEKIISSLNGLSYEELTQVANGDFSIIDERKILTNCVQTKDYQNGPNGYFIDYIVDNLNLEQVYKVSNVRFDKQSSIKEKIEQKLATVDIHKLYSALITAGVGYKEVPNYIVNLLLEDGYGEYDTFEKLVNSENLDEVIKENVNNLNSNITAYSLDRFLGILDNSYAVPDTNIVLREYQEHAVNGVDDIFETNRFAGVVLPTGAGKSFVAMAELMKFQKKSIVYFAPQDEILNQFQKHILKNILGKSILTIEDISKMESMSDSERIEFLNGKVYNQSVDIASELKKLKKGSLTAEEKDKIMRGMLPRRTEKNDDVMDAIKLVFPHLEMHCYQSLNGSEYQDLVKKNADLIVFDELHRTGAKTWQPLIDGLLKKNESAKILGITATPIRDDDHADMMKYMAENYGEFTKEEIEDKAYLAEEMYLIDAMQNKYVVEPKIVSFSSSLANTEEYQFVVDRLNEERKRNPSSELVRELETIKNSMDEIINGGRKSIENNLPAVGKVIEENIPVSLKNGRFIVFLPRKSDDFEGSSEEYVQSQIEKINGMLKSVNPNIDSGYLLSNRQDKSKNAEAISNFETSDSEFLKVLYAINMLNEGVHVENINGEIMLRPIGSGSNILYFQQIGRVIFSIDPKNPLSEDEVPIIFDVYNNYLARNLDRVANTTNPTSDLNNIQMVKNWINRHERMPDINSKNQDEARKAIILKKIQEKYEGYLEGINNENLSETEIREIRKILEIAKSINLFDIDIPDRIIPPGEKELGRVNAFAIKGEVKSFLELFKKSKEAIKEHSKTSKDGVKIPKSLRIRNIMSVLQILNEYGFNITDEHLTEIYMKLNPDNEEKMAKEKLTLFDVLENGFSEKTRAVIIRELGMDLDELKEFLLYDEFDYARESFYAADGRLKKAFSYFDIKDIRKCGLLKSNGEFTPAVNKSGFITEYGPKAFQKINIYTGTNYDKDGYDIEGYDILGYDVEGYDKEGFDKYFFRKGDSINKYGFNRKKVNVESGMPFDKNFFDFEGYYWKANPEFPDDITKRINTFEKVNGDGLDRDGIVYIRNEDGNLVPKYTSKGFFDIEGNYWKANPEFPEDITKRINTFEKVNEEGFDKDGYYYIKNENGEWVNTGNLYNEAGFDSNHLYHKIPKNGKKDTRYRQASGKYDDEGYNFYGINRRRFNREHMYLNEDGSFSFLNPQGVGYDGYIYDFDEKTQSYIKKEKYYDEEGYDYDGLDDCLFDRNHLYMGTKKWSPYLFDWKHDYRGQYGKKLDDYGFDYKQDYQGILGRKYDRHNFDRDGYFYRLNPETNQMEKTNNKVNDKHFGRDRHYYEYIESSGEYVRTEYITDPHGVDIDGKMYKDKIRDKEFYNQFIEGEFKKVEQSLNESLNGVERLVETVKTYAKQVEEKNKQIPSSLVSKKPMEYINNALELCDTIKETIVRAKEEHIDIDYAENLAKKIQDDIKKASGTVEHVREELEILDKKVSMQNEKEKQLEEKSQKIKSAKADFKEEFDENGTCKETGLKYNKFYFTVDGTNVITKRDFDMRGFDCLGRCRDNNLLPYDKNRFKMDGTHFETGEKYYKGYNAYGVDENGKNRKGNTPKELEYARKYVSAMFDSENPNALKDFLLQYMKNHGIRKSQDAVEQLKIYIIKAGEMYPPFKTDIVEKVNEICEKIEKSEKTIEDLRQKGARFAMMIKSYEQTIAKLKSKLNNLSFNAGDR